LNIKIIGLGGIGSVLAEKLGRFLNFYEYDSEIHVTLIDGDDYELKNLERQEFFNFGNKALVKCDELSTKFEFVKFSGLPYFVDQDTVQRLIENGDIVFIAVDNHKARKIISDRVKSLENVVVISGGNELLDGNIQIYLRKEGYDLTPTLTAYHPEIENPMDKLPSEMSCEELSKSDPQIFFVNLGVATLMCWAFYNVIVRNETRYSEVYFDMSTMCADSKQRAVI